MASADVEKNRSDMEREEACLAKPTKQGEGLRQYYMQHIHDLWLQLNIKSNNLNRLEAQRNELNSKGLIN